jgi:hypothetical protein
MTEDIEWGEMTPIPVHIQRSETENIAPSATSWNAFTIPSLAVNQPVRLVNHNYHRYKAKFLWLATGADTVWLARVQDYVSGNPGGTVYKINIAAAITQSVSIIQDYDGQQPIFAISQNGLVTVSVFDETYKSVQ